MKRSFKKGLSTAEQILAMPKGPPDPHRDQKERDALSMFTDSLDQTGRRESADMCLPRYRIPAFDLSQSGEASNDVRDCLDPSTNLSREQAAARRLCEAVRKWRADNHARPGFVLAIGKGGTRIDPGPPLETEDLSIVASLGPIGAAMVAKLRAWSEAAHAPTGGPDNAVGFLICLAEHGEVVALARWSAPSAMGGGQDKTSESITESELNDSDTAIVKAIRASPGITGKLIAAEAHLSLENVKKRLSKGMPLHVLGFRVPKGRKGYDPPQP